MCAAAAATLAALTSCQSIAAPEGFDVSKEQVAKYVTEINNCYDTDGNRMLDEKEMAVLVEGMLTGETCPNEGSAPLAYSSKILLNEDVKNIENWVGKNFTSLEKIYNSKEDRCNTTEFNAAINGRENIIVLGMTTDGFRFGAYIASTLYCA